MNVYASFMSTDEDEGRLSPGEPRLVRRPRNVRLLAAFGGGFLTLVGIGIAGAAISDAVAGAGGAVFLAGIPLIVYAAVRGFRISLVADEASIVIRNYFRTYRLRWDEIAETGIGLHQMGGLLSDAIYFRRKGRRLVVTAQATMLNPAERECILRELHRLRPDIPVRARRDRGHSPT